MNLNNLHILHISSTFMAGSPMHISNAINKYTNHKSICVVRRIFRSEEIRNLSWEYDYITPSTNQINKLIKWADVIHFHAKPQMDLNVKGKLTLLHYHAYNHRKINKYSGRDLVVAQYQPRYFEGVKLAPNIIDIWDDMYKPGKKNPGAVKIFYSISSEVKNTWADKGSTYVLPTLKKLKQKYKHRIDIRKISNSPYKKCMEEKRTSDIVIGDTKTGAYHLTSLEGLSTGNVVLNNIDKKSFQYLREICNAQDHPFDITNEKNLFENLCKYIDNKNLLRKKQLENRKWMETHWDPKKMVRIYTNLYEGLLR